MYIKNATKGTIVAEHVWLADTFWKRLKGLLGTNSLGAGYGLVIKPCNSIHTFGMNYPIDVLFINCNHKIIKIVTAMKKRQMARASGSSYVIELPRGRAKEMACAIGDIIEFG